MNGGADDDTHQREPDRRTVLHPRSGLSGSGRRCRDAGRRLGAGGRQRKSCDPARPRARRAPRAPRRRSGSIDKRLAVARVGLLETSELDEHVRVVREAHDAAELVGGAAQMRLGLGRTRPRHEQHAEVGARLGGHVGVVQRAPVVLLGVVDRAERPGQLGVAEQHGAGGAAHQRREEEPRSLREPALPAAELGVERAPRPRTADRARAPAAGGLPPRRGVRARRACGRARRGTRPGCRHRRARVRHQVSASTWSPAEW